MKEKTKEIITKRKEQSKGITLIALVITIIVLLILAGVTIATLTGDNGLLSKANSAKNTSTDSEIEEKVKLAYQDYYLGQYSNPGYTFQNALDKMFGTGVATVTETNGIYKVTFTNGKKYTFNALTKELAVLEEIWTQDGTTVTDTRTGTTYDVGDTVYYDSGVEEYEGTGDNQGKWAILGAEEGKLLIMSKENVGEVELRGKQDYLTTGTTKLNNICSSFKNSLYADSIRSVKVEDINRVTGFDNIPDSIENTHSYTMVNGYVKMDDNEPSTWAQTFEDINGKTLPYDSPILVINDAYGYKLTRYIISGSKVDNLLNNNYWLDSPYVFASTDLAYWGFRTVSSSFVSSSEELWDSSIGAFGSSRGVRAVVTLKSNVKLVEGTDGWTLQQ